MKKLSMVIIVLSVMAGLAVGEKTKSFCEYGVGVSERLGAGGAKWNQDWGMKAYDWYDCQASPNVGILNKNVVGVLETTTSGAPAIDGDYILRLPFGGFLNLTAYDQGNSGKVAGEIKGTVAFDLGDPDDPADDQYDGLFVADLNAAHAVVDDVAGTITIKFGAAVNSDPGSLITITETTGKFKSITPVGKWEFYVSGTITCALVDGLPLQTNILAALGNSDLLLGAQEEIVLAGSYYRNSPKK